MHARPAARAAAATLTGAVTAVLVPLLVALGLALPAAADPVTPGAFTGHAFDARCAPTSAQMDAWLTSSPYWGVGVYVGGSTRSCGADEQPHLDRAWVARQSGRGWRVLPIWVGPQAACSGYTDRIDPAPADRYAAAAAEGRREAAAAVARLAELGVPRGSTVWYDLEDFDLQHSDDCRRSALRFLSAWTLEVRARGHRSGVYSNVAAAVHALDNAEDLDPGAYELPDQVWFAWENGRADTHVPDRWVDGGRWAGQRIHQYDLDVAATHGGVTLEVDRNFLEVGGGSRAPRAPRTCGVRVDFPDYARLRLGARGPQVAALQCLLSQQRRYRGRADGRFDAPVARAVTRWQRAAGLRATGRVDARSWTVLHAQGSAPLLKRGSVGAPVRRLQRALNVATAADLAVTGVVDAATERWAATYQRAVGLPAPGAVGADTWAALRAGRR